MPLKFGRNYLLRVQKNNSSEFLEINYPLTLNFDVKRNFFSSSNVANIRVLNLSESSRSLITKTQTDYGLFKNCELYAGYGDRLQLCFSGNVSSCLSYRDGINVITEIQAFDGGWSKNNTYVDYSYAKGDRDIDIVKKIISKTNLRQGAIVMPDNVRKKNGSVSGNAFNVIQDLSNGSAFIDLETINILDSESYLNERHTLVIDDDSGLLTTPRIEGNFITFDILFESNLRVGQLLTIKNNVNSFLNGNYRVQLVNHKGVISGAVGGDFITQVGVLRGFFNNGINLGQ